MVIMEDNLVSLYPEYEIYYRRINISYFNVLIIIMASIKSNTSFISMKTVFALYISTKIKEKADNGFSK